MGVGVSGHAAVAGRNPATAKQSWWRIWAADTGTRGVQTQVSVETDAPLEEMTSLGAARSMAALGLQIADCSDLVVVPT